MRSRALSRSVLSMGFSLSCTCEPCRDCIRGVVSGDDSRNALDGRALVGVCGTDIRIPSSSGMSARRMVGDECRMLTRRSGVNKSSDSLQLRSCVDRLVTRGSVNATDGGDVGCGDDAIRSSSGGDGGV